MQPTARSTSAASRAYFALTGLLLVYVALCAGQWDNHPHTDLWEHHRAVVALRDAAAPSAWPSAALGNPTFAVDTPSVRYSPYSVILAMAAGASGFAPHPLLAAAAVMNTLLLLLGFYALLSRLGATAAGAAFLILMVSLYGSPPGYAGSLALSDLPWQQSNPSAFALAIAVWALVAFDALLAAASSGQRTGLAALISIALAVVLLSHGMTALLAGIALLALAWIRESSLGRTPALAVVVGMSLAAAAIGSLWPYYSLPAVLLHSSEEGYWFNSVILRRMLFDWCLPGAFAALVALPLRREAAVRFGLITGGTCYFAGLVAIAFEAASFARLPLVGLTFLHLAAAVAVYRSGLLQPSTWPERIRNLIAFETERSYRALIELAVAVAICLSLVPQLSLILREPHLARAYVAPLVGGKDKQLDLLPRYERLLAEIAPGDVVMADPVTAWPVPSVGGRIVSALHWELLVDGQRERADDVEAFFSRRDDLDRAALVRKYDARWILLSPRSDMDTHDRLLEGAAVTKSEDGWVLMDAARWLRARAGDA